MKDLESGTPSEAIASFASRVKFFSLTILEWIALPIILASFLGLIINIVYFFSPGPVFIYGTGVAIWLCAFCLWYCFLIFHNTRKPLHDVIDWFWAQELFYTYSFVTSFIITICYAINNRAEGYGWAILLLFLSGANAGILLSRLKLSRESLRPQIKSGGRTSPWCRGQSKGGCVGCCSCLKVWIFINAIFMIFFLALLTNGALIEGQAPKFPPRGKFVTVSLADGAQQRIHYLCEGPQSTTHDTILFDADGSHGMSDFWGMQKFLTAAGRRVCVFDKPGLGWSDYWRVSQNLNSSTFYHQFLTSIGERAPFVLAGWGGGGEIVWEYANQHPEMVSAIIFMDVYSSGIEWREIQYSRNLTDDQMRSRRSLDIMGRSNLFYIIKGLGSVWGLNTIFVPYNPTGFEPAERYDEYRWFYLTDKTWSTQFPFLLQQGKTPLSKDSRGVFDYVNPTLRVPIHHIMTNLNNTVICGNAKFAAGTPECEQAIRSNAFMKEDQYFVANRTGRASFSFCDAPDCSQSFPLNKAKWASDEILKRFP